MIRIAKWLCVLAAAAFVPATMAHSQEARAGVVFPQPQLDQMLAPIALYPDSLLSQILMAATYPQDVAEAASWSRAHGNPRGDQAVRSVESRPWDPSVMSLVAFPEVLTMMDERRDWTARLGDAFLAQPDQVMDTVQDLRARADAAGTLRSSEELVVQRQGDDYVIEPPTPEVVYVPYYDSRTAYGTWWWPEYQPVYWSAWPGYGYSYGYRGFGWGPRISIGSGFFFGSFNWHGRHLRYAHHRPWYYHGHSYRGGSRWNRSDYRRDGRGDRGDGRGGYRGDERGDRAARETRRDGGSRARIDGGSSQDRGQQRQGRSADRAMAPTQGSAPTQPGFFAPRAESARVESARAPAPTVDGQRVQSQRIAAQRLEYQRSQSAGGSPAVRQAAPRYGVEGRGQARRDAVQDGQPAAAQRGYAPRQSQAAPQYNPPASRSPVERVAPAQRSAPVERVERAAPVQRSAPAQRSAPSRSPVERSGGGREGGRER